MNVSITPGKLSGVIQAPPSKSYAHRMILCAALAEGTSFVHGVALSEDIRATLDCIQSLGAEHKQDDSTFEIHGGIQPSANPKFPCRESGSTLRFFIPPALLASDSATFIGTERLIERGIHVYEDLFRTHDITFTLGKTEIQASGRLQAGDFTAPGNISSQYISGLLFALPLLPEDSTLTVVPPVESRPYIDITIAAMQAFGVTIREPEPNVFLIPGGQKYQCKDTAVEGDWSNAAFLYALKELGNEITVTGLKDDSIQGDKVCLPLFRKLDEADTVIDIADCPDLAPILFALAATKRTTRFTGTKRLKIKECDRGQAMAEELQKLGVKTVVEDNAVTVYGGKISAPTTVISGHNDHRIVMAMTVLATLVGGKISDAQAVRKSYPNFFEDMESLGLEVQYAN